ncbi:MAG TPA: caspase family protein [Syntrophales bacterium]|nr:caspase family protein [Syntrophales bacterium]
MILALVVFLLSAPYPLLGGDVVHPFEVKKEPPARPEIPRADMIQRELPEPAPRLSTAAGQRTALVIGNSAYSSGPLKNPVNDATAMAAQLRDLGFAVILKRDAGLRAMDEALAEFGDRLKRGGVGLFYYAGHGLQIGGVNYLVPIGAKINRESDARYEAMDAGKVLDEMANANNGLNIVILDACRDNPFARSFRNTARGLAIVSNAPAGTFISYSTSPGQVARDGDGRNSPYTSALLQYMKEPGIPITDMFMKVRQKLRQETGQIPWELSSLEGKFFFVPEGGAHQAEHGAGDQTRKEQLEKDHSPIQSEGPSSFADLKRKMAEKQARENQWSADFEDAKKMEQMSSSLSEKIEVWRQFMVTVSDGQTAKSDEFRKYATNRIDLLERFRSMGKTLPKEIKNDGRFVAFEDGTVLDTQTNLMWAAKDNGYDIKDHGNAKRYCENYHGGGYSDWRMPTRNELAGLYDQNKPRSRPGGKFNTVHVASDSIEITSIWSWSSETRNHECNGGFFNFLYGSGSWSCPGDTVIPRVLPVRSAK